MGKWETAWRCDHGGLHHLLPLSCSLMEFLRLVIWAPGRDRTGAAPSSRGCMATPPGISFPKSSSKLPPGWRKWETEEQQHLQGSVAVPVAPAPPHVPTGSHSKLLCALCNSFWPRIKVFLALGEDRPEPPAIQKKKKISPLLRPIKQTNTKVCWTFS